MTRSKGPDERAGGAKTPGLAALLGALQGQRKIDEEPLCRQLQPAGASMVPEGCGTERLRARFDSQDKHACT